MGESLDDLDDLTVDLTETITKNPEEHDHEQYHQGEDKRVFCQALSFFKLFAFQCHHLLPILMIFRCKICAVIALP